VASPWLQRLGPAPAGPFAADPPAFRLVCFPHAGGQAAAFRLWPGGLPTGTELFGVQYPGRGSRIGEPPVDRIPEMARHVARALLALPARRMVFFGHSMGALVAFETARQLAAAGHALPEHLFLSGHAPPHLKRTHPPVSLLPDLDFLAQLNARYAAVPAELMQHPDVLALLLPALRADVTAVEAHAGLPRTVLACPITAFGGREDGMATPAQLEAWRDLTNAAFRLRLFRGGHFFLDAERASVLGEIAAVLGADSGAPLPMAHAACAQ
jgi:surfactin synthase thioesterase subunit